MKKKRISVEQFTGKLKQAELGAPIAELCRQHGISAQSYYRMNYYRSGKDPLTALRQRVRGFAHARVRFGYRRVYMLLKREVWDTGRSRLYRV